MLLPWQSLMGRPPLLSPAFRHSTLRRQVPPRLQDARDPSSEGWNYGREYCPINLAEMSTSTPFRYLLHAAKYDMGPTALLPLRKEACWGCFRPKNPTTSAGFETANSDTRGQHANPYTTEAAWWFVTQYKYPLHIPQEISINCTNAWIFICKSVKPRAIAPAAAWKGKKTARQHMWYWCSSIRYWY